LAEVLPEDWVLRTPCKASSSECLCPVKTLTFDLVPSEPNQFIFVPVCMSEKSLEKNPHPYPICTPDVMEIND